MDGGAAASLPVMRTVDEADLYFDLHGCPRCGSVDTSWNSGLVAGDGGLARRYSGSCGECGLEREFVFGVPEPALVPPVAARVFFGADEPSQVLDAGEWLWVADLVASRTPEDPAGAAHALAVAAAAVEEIMKFAPDGADRVPEDAFWSVRGRRVRAEDPGRFEVDRLAVVRDSYHAQLAELEGRG